MTNARPPFYQRLGARLALMVAVAMLPLGFLGLVQSQAADQEAEQRANLAIMDETMRAAAPEIRLIQAAQVMAATLAHSVVYTLDDPGRCLQLMKAVAAQEPALAVVAFVPRSGLLTCSSAGKRFDLSRSPGFLKIVQMDQAGFTVTAKGAISGVSVLSVSAAGSGCVRRADRICVDFIAAYGAGGFGRCCSRCQPARSFGPIDL